MNRKLNSGLSLAVGLLGGCLSHYVFPERVQAAQLAPPKQVMAQSFMLVNSDGSPAGLFGFDLRGRPEIELFDSTGKVVWSTQGTAKSKPLAISAAK
jgi:hypothetical protein